MVQTQMGFYEQGKQNYLEDARREAKRLLRVKPSITTDDIWKACPPPKYINSKIMGQVFRHPDFEQTGEYEKTTRPSSHGRYIWHYRLKQHDNTHLLEV